MNLENIFTKVLYGCIGAFIVGTLGLIMATILFMLSQFESLLNTNNPFFSFMSLSLSSALLGLIMGYRMGSKIAKKNNFKSFAEELSHATKDMLVRTFVLVLMSILIIVILGIFKSQF